MKNILFSCLLTLMLTDGVMASEGVLEEISLNSPQSADLDQFLDQEGKILSLRGNKVTEEICPFLVSYIKGVMVQKEDLQVDLGKTGLTTQSVLFLAENLQAQHPITLSLFGNDLKDSAVAKLLKNNAILGLNLTKTGISPRAFDKIAENFSQTLKHLNVSYNPKISDEGLALLASHPTLTTLYARGCEIGDDGATEFSEKNLSIVNVSFAHNSIHDVGFSALLKNGVLKVLKIYDNPVAAFDVNFEEEVRKSGLEAVKLGQDKIYQGPHAYQYIVNPWYKAYLEAKKETKKQRSTQ